MPLILVGMLRREQRRNRELRVQLALAVALPLTETMTMTMTMTTDPKLTASAARNAEHIFAAAQVEMVRATAMGNPATIADAEEALEWATRLHHDAQARLEALPSPTFPTSGA